ncbi:MAG: thioredoxin-like domain-containing protein [Planctomycetota bacterium]|jgi:thiol-disulfide isomerase/thioredoxin
MLMPGRIGRNSKGAAKGALVVVAACVILAVVSSSLVGRDRTRRLQGTAKAREFPKGLDWLNTDRPITMAELKGKVVVLDFWTYCCINCMHVLPDLAKLEAKYPDELVVVGVHSAKFTGEKVTDNIRQAILRYNITHPVINDHQMKLWRSYRVRAWPTLVLIDPAGRVVGQHSGEGVYEPFDKQITELIEGFDKTGELDRTPLAFELEGAKVGRTVLSFPGKVLAVAKGKEPDRLFIADSNHHRIVVVSLTDNSVQAVVGSGQAGMEDGSFESATFNNPQGMVLAGEVLYVADTGNHALRAVNLAQQTVTTVAGTGRQARWGAGGGPGRQTDLASPWDVEVVERSLFVAMAGSHQIWRMDLDSGEIAPYAGSGREGRVDGPLSRAALAQPSGLTSDGQTRGKLYFADSEVSAIRSADLRSRGDVTTVVGGNLFDFGDVDGRGRRARLQHPLGVAYDRGLLYVADTYNNKVKRVDIKKQLIKTWLGDGEAGLVDGDDREAVRFDEPGGVSVAAGKLYVADTNNHVIRVVSLTKGAVSTLQLTNVELLTSAGTGDDGKEAFTGETISLATQSVRPGAVTVKIDLTLPEGLKLNADAPSSVVAISSNEAALALAEDFDDQSVALTLPMTISATAAEGDAMLTADTYIYYCSDGREAVCYFKQLRFVVPVAVNTSSDSDQVTIARELALPAGL